MTTTKHKLEITTPSATEILLTRQFNAPKALVYDCFTDPKKVQNWIGCGKGSMTVSEADNRIGGAWRWVIEMGEYGTHEFFGQILEIDPNNRLVRTFVYNVPMIREYVSTETLTLTETNGVTTLNVLVKHLTEEARDGHLNSGMEDGAGASYDNLERMLDSLQHTG